MGVRGCRVGTEVDEEQGGTAGHCVHTPGTGRHTQTHSRIHTLTLSCTQAHASAHCHTDLHWHLGGQPHLQSPVRSWVSKQTDPLHSWPLSSILQPHCGLNWTLRAAVHISRHLRLIRTRKRPAHDVDLRAAAKEAVRANTRLLRIPALWSELQWSSPERWGSRTGFFQNSRLSLILQD